MEIEFFLNTVQYPIHFTKLNVLFGVHDQIYSSVKNIIILVGKKYIWMKKFREQGPNLIDFCKYLLQYLNTLKMVHIIKNILTGFDDLWETIIVRVAEYIQDEPATPEEASP